MIAILISICLLAYLGITNSAGAIYWILYALYGVISITYEIIHIITHEYQDKKIMTVIDNTDDIIKTSLKIIDTNEKILEHAGNVIEYKKEKQK